MNKKLLASLATVLFLSTNFSVLAETKTATLKNKTVIKKTVTKPDTNPSKNVSLKPVVKPTPILEAVKPKAIQFFVIGDTGSGLKGQYELANAMSEYAQKSKPQFILMLGDNIYPLGDINGEGLKKFEKPYESFITAKTPFYPVLGNHDVPHQASQIKYFKMPGRFYTYIQGDVQFFALDTNAFDIAQKYWLKSNLANSKSKWKIVYGHHPVFSSGEHGNTKELLRNLKPLLETYKVDLYLCGHDHDYEVFAPVKGVHYIVSGGGGASLREFEKAQPNSIKRLKTFEFMSFYITSSEIFYKTIASDGKILDQGQIKKIGKK